MRDNAKAEALPGFPDKVGSNYVIYVIVIVGRLVAKDNKADD